MSDNVDSDARRIAEIPRTLNLSGQRFNNGNPRRTSVDNETSPSYLGEDSCHQLSAIHLQEKLQPPETARQLIANDGEEEDEEDDEDSLDTFHFNPISNRLFWYLQFRCWRGRSRPRASTTAALSHYHNNGRHVHYYSLWWIPVEVRSLNRNFLLFPYAHRCARSFQPFTWSTLSINNERARACGLITTTHELLQDDAQKRQTSDKIKKKKGKGRNEIWQRTSLLNNYIYY